MPSSSTIMTCWKNLPDVVFGDLMMILGLEGYIEGLEYLHRCRQVCQSWNKMIAQMTKYKKDNIRLKAECLAAKIREAKIREVWERWGVGIRFLNEEKVNLRYTLQFQLPEILTVASLAHHGLLGSVEGMYLKNLDLASVPAEHLASLASCVTNKVYIFKVNSCDIISILASVKCDELVISSQTLSSQETQAVVQAMESRVKRVTDIDNCNALHKTLTIANVRRRALSIGGSSLHALVNNNLRAHYPEGWMKQ